ncbi:MAG: hypothetical protein B7Z24_04350 [Pseudomonadales bacterium 32-42-5]|nr:MAG: hypothetical protein B7Z24_04350 [Pseudomonadales bacterium 32-42-5]
MLQQAVDQMHLSARGYVRVLKVSRTIADLAGCEKIALPHKIKITPITAFICH